MNLEYAQQYRTLYTQHWWWRAREHYILNMLRRLDLPQFASILDIGCGDALFFDILQHFGTPYGIEPNRTTLEAFCLWGFEQGLFHRHLTPEEMFPKEVQSEFKV